MSEPLALVLWNADCHLKLFKIKSVYLRIKSLKIFVIFGVTFKFKFRLESLPLLEH